MGRRGRGASNKSQLPIICFYCGREFKTVATLVDHQQARHFRCTECNRKLKTLSAMKNHLDGVHKVQLKRIPHAREGYDDPEIDCVGMEGAPSWFTQELTEKYGGPELQLLAATGKTADPPAAPAAAAQPAGTGYPPGLGMAPQMHPGAPTMGGHPGQHPVPPGYGAPPGYNPLAYGPGPGYPMPPMGGGHYPMPPRPPHPGMMPYGYPTQMHHMPPGYPSMMPPRPMMPPPHGSIAAQPAIAFQAATSSSASVSASSAAAAAVTATSAATTSSSSSTASAMPAAIHALSTHVSESGPTTSNGYGSALAPPRSALTTGPGAMSAVGLLSPNSAMPAPKASTGAAPKLRLVYDDEDLSPEERRAMLPRYKRT